MRHRKSSALATCVVLLLAVVVHTTTRGDNISTPSGEAPAGENAHAAPAVRYTIDAGRSKFIVRAFAGGALWFKGHDHFVAAKEFSGDAELTPDSVSPAALLMRVRAASLEETRDVFTPQQKQIINKELREIVLEPEKYPEIIFRSTDVSGKLEGSVYQVRIGGDLTLHGVTRHIVIPAQVSIQGRDLRAQGQFEIERGDFKIKATSAFHGTVRIRDRLKVIFEIVAHQA